MDMIHKYQQFSAFVESLKRPENASLIEAIQTGIEVVMEAGFEDDIGSAAVKQGHRENLNLANETRDYVDNLMKQVYQKFGPEGMQDVAKSFTASQLGSNAFKPNVLSQQQANAVKQAVLGKLLPYFDNPNGLSGGLTPSKLFQQLHDSALKFDPEKGDSFTGYLVNRGYKTQQEQNRMNKRETTLSDDSGEDGKTAEEKFDDINLDEMDSRYHGRPEQYGEEANETEKDYNRIMNKEPLKKLNKTLLEKFAEEKGLDDNQLKALTAYLNQNVAAVRKERVESPIDAIQRVLAEISSKKGVNIDINNVRPDEIKYVASAIQNKYLNAKSAPVKALQAAKMLEDEKSISDAEQQINFGREALEQWKSITGKKGKSANAIMKNSDSDNGVRIDRNLARKELPRFAKSYAASDEETDYEKLHPSMYGDKSIKGQAPGEIFNQMSSGR